MSAGIKEFRRVVTLPVGTQVLLRILKPEDREQLVELFKYASTTDLQYFRDDVRDAGLVARWAEQVNLAHVVPLVAIVQDRIVGEAMLQLGRGCDRHVAEVRIYLCNEFRGRGLGNVMIKALIDIGQELELHVLFARIAASQTKEIRAFQALGFKVEHTFKDRFINPAGDTQDMVEVVCCLRHPHVSF
jgi:L-amino acid N-acyltransferase YncA